MSQMSPMEIILLPPDYLAGIKLILLCDNKMQLFSRWQIRYMNLLIISLYVLPFRKSPSKIVTFHLKANIACCYTTRQMKPQPQFYLCLFDKILSEMLAVFEEFWLRPRPGE